jgi:predicted O-methyltransferase YrrM
LRAEDLRSLRGAYNHSMSKDQWTAVDRYISETLVQPEVALVEALADSAAAELEAINVSPPQGKLLMLLAQAVGARNILEIGTLGGYSTIWMARALPTDGRLISLEANPKCAEVARANIARAGLADVVDVRVGKALDTLPMLAAEGCGPFDFFFLDADKVNNPKYFEWTLKLSRPGSLIVADNVVRDGAVIDAASQDVSVQATRRLFDMMAAEPRVTVTAIQTVGGKGYDGFAVARVTS